MNSSQYYRPTVHKSLNLFNTAFFILPLALLPPKLPIYTSNFSHKEALSRDIVYMLAQIRNTSLADWKSFWTNINFRWTYKWTKSTRSQKAYKFFYRFPQVHVKNFSVHISLAYI